MKGITRRGWLALQVFVVSALASVNAQGIDLAQSPLFVEAQVPGNLALVPSVEYPTVLSVANLGDYDQSRTYTGYFDANTCYVYHYSATESERHFYPVGTTTNRRCTGSDQWSGNFLSWAATQTIDPFRMVLTGGYRVRDQVGVTWLEKARHNRTDSFPNRRLPAGNGNNSTLVQGATPFNANWVHTRIANQGNQMLIRMNNNVHGDGASEIINYEGGSTFQTNRTYRLSVRVSVCDARRGQMEPFCRQYSANNWKPEGLIQEYAEDVRFSIFGYLNDDNALRDGGVLRASKKYVGPRRRVPGEGWQDNPRREWDPNTGIFVRNPDSITSSLGVSINDSGVINYLNKFGQLNNNTFKSIDPVSELYYAAYRYFSGLGNVPEYSAVGDASAADRAKWADNFPVITSWDDPIEYACQANVILGIGDANTHRDKNLPGNTAYRTGEPNMPASVSSDNTVNVVTETNRVGNLEPSAVENLDAPAANVATLGNIGNSNSFTGRNNSAYMAGIAYRARTRDIRPDLNGVQTIATHWVDVLENQVLEPRASNQYYLAAKYGGFRVPDGFDPANANPSQILLQDWHTNGEMLRAGNQTNPDGEIFPRPDNYYVAGQADRMLASLSEAFASIVADVRASSASIAANSTRLDVDGLIYQARFNSANWRGDLFAYRLREDGSIRSEPAWSAADLLDAPGFSVATRRVFTSNDSNQRIDFRYNQLGQISGAVAAMNFDGRGADRVNYLRGDRSQERQNGGPFRTRGSRLGDIINSDPAYMGRETFGYQGLPGDEGASYPLYVSSKRNNPDRPPVLFVGANDGMLHAFHADTGEELFAYVPRMLVNQMAQLSSPDYNHRYYVDGAPTVSDVYINGQWRTIVVGTLGAGGRGIFALDVTNPRDPQVLWEFQHPELGEGVTQASVLRIQTGNNNAGTWVVAVGNGYNSQSNQSGIILINAATGTLRQAILTGRGNASNRNGMAPLLAINSSGGRIADTLYAGDLHGNLWKFDQVPQGGNRWDFRVANNGAEMFQGRVNPGNRAQPITSMPEAALNEDGDVMIFFGTGKYLESDDVELAANNVVNTAYAIIDDGSSGLRRGDLHQQRIVYEDVSNGRQVRGVTTDPRPDDKKGWYLDLVPPSGQRQGERIVVRPVLRGSAVVFSTLIPSDNPCDTGGTSWLMALDIDNGSAVVDGFFDINDDGVINEDDFIMVDGQLIPVAGLGSESGILTRANFLSGSEGVDVGYLSDSTGNTQRVRVRGSAFNLGRQSWRQIR